MNSLVDGVLSAKGIPLFPPWLFRSDNGHVTGVFVKVIDEMSSRLNATYELQLRKIETMDSILNSIAQRIIDLGLAPFVRELDARVGVMFTDPLTDMSHSFLFGLRNQKTTPLALATPFTWDTWLLLVSVVLLMGPILYLTLTKREDKQKRADDVTPKSTNLRELSDCAWYIYGCAVQQGGTLMPTSLSPRLIIAFWWLFILLVTTTYSGNLIASLTIPIKDSHLSTIQQLIELTPVKVIVKKNSPLAKYLQASANPFHAKLMTRATLVESVDLELLEKVKTREFIYLDTVDELRTVIQLEFEKTGDCSFGIVDQRFINLPISIAMTNSSVLRSQINNELLKIAQSGLIQKWKKDYQKAATPCYIKNHPSLQHSNTVDLQDVKGVIYLTLIGWLLALIAALVEQIWKRAHAH